MVIPASVFIPASARPALAVAPGDLSENGQPPNPGLYVFARLPGRRLPRVPPLRRLVRPQRGALIGAAALPPPPLPPLPLLPPQQHAEDDAEEEDDDGREGEYGGPDGRRRVVVVVRVPHAVIRQLLRRRAASK
eukprot:gene8995-biopygen4627